MRLLPGLPRIIAQYQDPLYTAPSNQHNSNSHPYWDRNTILTFLPKKDNVMKFYIYSQNRQNWLKMDKNGRKIDKIGQKWTKLAKNGQNWANIGHKFTKIGQQMTKLTKNGLNWTKTDKGSQKWTKLDKNRQR